MKQHEHGVGCLAPPPLHALGCDIAPCVGLMAFLVLFSFVVFVDRVPRRAKHRHGPHGAAVHVERDHADRDREPGMCHDTDNP